MFPFVPPGSLVDVTPCVPEELEPGVVVCYVGPDGRLFAHRVIAVEDGPDGPVVLTRGDGQTNLERAPFTAVAFRALRVRFGPLGYGTDGPVGHAAARLATGNEIWWRGLRRLTVLSGWVCSSLWTLARGKTDP